MIQDLTHFSLRERLRDGFVRTYHKTDKKAVETLLRDWERMVTFYSFPREHWRHLRSTNIVEWPFAAVRLLPLVASGMTFKDGIVLPSGQERNGMNHQLERTAA